MNIIEALQEIKAKSNNKDHINRFMVVSEWTIKN